MTEEISSYIKSKIDVENGPEIKINILKKSHENKIESYLEEIEFQEFNVEKIDNKFSRPLLKK